ncbi:MAG: OmpA family protein [Gammaproteobacteria bacterium]|nr:OmpA family protein [Gammaproteobacteria bacterium]
MACGVALAAQAQLQQPVLTIKVQSGEVQIRGDVSSSGNETILSHTAEQLFESVDLEVRLPQQMPPGWSLLTELALRALARTESANARIDASSVSIQGVTEDLAGYDHELQRLQRALLPGMTIDSRVAMIRRNGSLTDHCRRVFAIAKRGRSVEFAHAGTQPKPTAAPLLDALAELSVDCPHATILVTGHSDAAGNEEQNIALSAARAQAVVAALVERGVAAERLQALGAGSARPVADNSTASGRRRNRRIEFSLEFAELD